jgi:hypothetical protein
MTNEEGMTKSQVQNERGLAMRPFSAASGSKRSRRRMVTKLRRISGSSSMINIFWQFSFLGKFSQREGAKMQRTAGDETLR